MRLSRLAMVGAALLLGSCDEKRDPPPDSREFSKLMEKTQELFKPEVTLFLCNRSSFDNHATDRKDHVAQPAREAVSIKFETYNVGSFEPKGSADSQEAVFKNFTEWARVMVRYPKREGEDQLYRFVKIDADPGMPEDLVERLESILKSVGARVITRAAP